MAEEKNGLQYFSKFLQIRFTDYYQISALQKAVLQNWYKC